MGATLLQEGRPIANASKSLNDSQRAYAQIEKELLAIVFGCKKYSSTCMGEMSQWNQTTNQLKLL